MVALGIEPRRPSGEEKQRSTTRSAGPFQAKSWRLYHRNLNHLRRIRTAAGNGWHHWLLPAVGHRFPSPTPPAVGTTPNIAALFWNCTHLHPSGFRRRSAAVTMFQHRLPRLVAQALSLVLPTAGQTSLATCLPGSGGSRPRLCSLRSPASSDDGLRPTGFLPRPLRRSGA
jgi:hypothetical protein